MVLTAQERKDRPVYSGVIAYFPDALMEVARVSKAGNDQHNPGQPLHWDKSKSTDEDDAMTRHMIDRAKGIKLDTDGQRHRAKAAWRALAALQREIEEEQTTYTATIDGKPVEPGQIKFGQPVNRLVDPAPQRCAECKTPVTCSMEGACFKGRKP